MLNEQSADRGMHSAGAARGGQGTPTGNNDSMFCGDHAGNGARHGDSGGASRFYPQFASFPEALDWLAKLIGGP
jgi:hypothetical protein